MIRAALSRTTLKPPEGVKVHVFPIEAKSAEDLQKKVYENVWADKPFAMGDHLTAHGQTLGVQALIDDALLNGGTAFFRQRGAEVTARFGLTILADTEGRGRTKH